MGTGILERIHSNLLSRRVGLTEWLRATPLQKKRVLLGPLSEQAVSARLGAIDDSVARVESGTLGRCKVCHGQIEPEFLEIDYTACVCIEHLSEQQVRHLETELELAQSVQRALLPQKVPNIPGLEIAAFSRPAEIVGGDYFDFVEFGSGSHGLAIADVAGHGVSASLNMASIHAMLHASVSVDRSPAEVVKRIHELFVHNIRFTTFVTFFMGAFDPITKTLVYCNAGHNPPLVLCTKRTHDPITWLRPTGAAIGLVEEAEFGEQTIALNEGDLFVMYTDGVTEAVNPQLQEFGRERLAALIEQVHQGTPKDVVREIRAGLEAYGQGNPLADDTTIVVCRIA